MSSRRFTVVNIGKKPADVDVLDEVLNSVVIVGTIHPDGDRSSTARTDSSGKFKIKVTNKDNGRSDRFEHSEDGKRFLFDVD